MVMSRFSGEFFGAVEALLSPSDGVLVMEAITVPEVTQPPRHVTSPCRVVGRRPLVMEAITVPYARGGGGRDDE